VTSPNNPNGYEAYEEGRLYDVWDAAYASPIYGWSGLVPYHRIAVFSAAKLFGLSGLRVGWLVTPDPVLAEKAAAFVESQTSGVAVIAQSIVAHVLHQDLLHPDSTFIQNATKALKANREYFHDAFYTSAVMVNIGEDKGMFAWYSAPKMFNGMEMSDILVKAGVRAMPGKAFGLPETSTSWRFSLGNFPHIHQKGVDAILAASKG
jgi:aspartate/methionine/tyrosine aminotransferase